MVFLYKFVKLRVVFDKGRASIVIVEFSEGFDNKVCNMMSFVDLALYFGPKSVGNASNIELNCWKSFYPNPFYSVPSQL